MATHRVAPESHRMGGPSSAAPSGQTLHRVLQARKSGHGGAVVSMASLGGIRPEPGTGMYGVGKAMPGSARKKA